MGLRGALILILGGHQSDIVRGGVNSFGEMFCIYVPKRVSLYILFISRGL